MTTDTLIEAPLQSRRTAASDESAEARFKSLRKDDAGERVFRIRSADSYVQRREANELLQDRYAWRGYHAVSLPVDQTSNRITLSAFDDAATIGTITVALDGPEGLSAEDAFPSEIRGLRSEGLRVCEFTKLAIDPDTGSKRVLAALFHVAYMVAHKIRGCDVLVMEVNPRHVRYYQRMLGARVIGEQRLNRSVNAPAVLLSMPFAYVAAQIAEFGGRDDLAAEERSLYPFAFSQREEQGILGRLMAAQQAASERLN